MAGESSAGRTAACQFQCQVAISAAQARKKPDGHASSGDLTSAQMHENAQIIYDMLVGKGWSLNAICAVLGNMQHESVTINPGRWQNGGGSGYGLVQWDPASKYLNWAAQNGYAEDSLCGQVEYLVASMQPGAGEWFRNSRYPDCYLSYSKFITSNSSVDHLTKVFLWSYERPGVSHIDRRVGNAMYWYDYFS